MEGLGLIVAILSLLATGVGVIVAVMAFRDDSKRHNEADRSAAAEGTSTTCVCGWRGNPNGLCPNCGAYLGLADGTHLHVQGRWRDVDRVLRRFARGRK